MNFLGEIFWEDFFWEQFFGSNSLGAILCCLNMEGIDLDFCQDFVSMPGRKGGRKDKNLDP